jgi:hypothetical protein
MRRPIYLDGPLKDKDHPIPEGLRNVEAKNPNLEHWAATRSVVTYQFKKFGLAFGGTTFYVWLGWCGHYDEPSAETIANALFKPEIIERGESDILNTRSIFYEGPE